jgi:hypothetical protein
LDPTYHEFDAFAMSSSPDFSNNIIEGFELGSSFFDSRYSNLRIRVNDEIKALCRGLYNPKNSSSLVIMDVFSTVF